MPKHLFLAATAVIAAVVATSAGADIVAVAPSSIQGDNVLFIGGVQTGTSVTGTTQGGVAVDSTGTTVGGAMRRRTARTTVRFA